ncbi:MAG: hypothetical protein LBP85_03970 [Prevotellaceae bacterium]|jgi:hypothetical protein|nr:hypothetical protein [Prevotellaceae bacterium]
MKNKEIKLEIIDDKVKVTSPYHSQFISKARNLRGIWKDNAFWFDDSMLEYVREIMLNCFGSTGEISCKNCEVKQANQQKTRENIIKMIPKNHSFYSAIILRIDAIINFYEKYPQYDFLKPEEVFFVLLSMKFSGELGVRVYDFGGKIGFVGTFIDDDNTPIAGDFPNIIEAGKSSFYDLLDENKIIDILKL